MQAPGTVPNAVLAILQDGREHQLDEISAALPDYTRDQISRAVTALKNRGLMMRQEVSGHYQLSAYGVDQVRAGYQVNSGPIEARGKARRQQDTFRARAWRAMRVRRVFSLGDIIADARDGEADPYDNLTRYVRLLIAAKYMVEVPVRTPGTSLTSPGFKRYRLVRDTGPKAPVYRPELGTMADFNTESEVSCR